MQLGEFGYFYNRPLIHREYSSKLVDTNFGKIKIRMQCLRQLDIAGFILKIFQNFGTKAVSTNGTRADIWGI